MTWAGVEPVIWFLVVIGAGVGVLIWRELHGVPASLKVTPAAPADREAQLMAKVTELSSTVETLLVKLNEAQREIDRLRARVSELEVAQARQGSELRESRPAKPLLLVMCNKLFGEDDALAIRRTGLPFHRLRDATSRDFDRYLQGCRQDGATPWWVQISAHMGPEGIQFADAIKDVVWLSQRIRGVRVLLLAGCENEEVAAQLVGLARHVIVIYETIDTTNAQDFSYAFWSRIEQGATEAFAGALAECPQVSEFVQMRTAQGPFGGRGKAEG